MASWLKTRLPSSPGSSKQPQPSDDINHHEDIEALQIAHRGLQAALKVQIVR